MDESVAIRVLGRLLAGLPARSACAEAIEWLAVARAGRFHGVLPLIHAGWSPDALIQATSGDFARACADEARAVAALDLSQRVATTGLLARLSAAGVRPLLLKGAALAHTHYPSSALRPRSDLDLLVQEAERPLCAAAFTAMGYQRVLQLPGHYVSHQESWKHPSPAGSVSVDLHWRVNNSPVLAGLMPYDELAAESLSIPALGPAARCPGPAQALLLAALHREGSRDAPYHHAGWSIPGGDRLVWLVDFVRLLRLADPDQRRQMAALIAAKGAQPLLSGVVQALQRWLPELAADELPVLRSMAQGGTPERRLQRYVSAGPWARRILDFAALGSWRVRAGFLAEQLYPPADYLQARDPQDAGASRLVLALKRVVKRAIPRSG
jgi:hypothetical protein